MLKMSLLNIPTGHKHQEVNLKRPRIKIDIVPSIAHKVKVRSMMKEKKNMRKKIAKEK